jgi:hypothetical protein
MRKFILASIACAILSAATPKPLDMGFFPQFASQ